MATRAQLELTNEEDKVLLYHHFDGYPEWLIPGFIHKAFLHMVGDVAPSYEHMCFRPEAAALYFADAHFNNVRELNAKYKDRGWKTPICSGFEFCDAHGLHADIEWFYIVHLVPERFAHRQSGARETRRGWLTEVLTPTKAYWEAKQLPRYISEAEDLLEKQGELFVARDGIEYLGELPCPGELYEQRWRNLDGKPIIERLRVLEVDGWLVEVDTFVEENGKVEHRGSRKMAPFRLVHSYRSATS